MRLQTLTTGLIATFELFVVLPLVATVFAVLLGAACIPEPQVLPVKPAAPAVVCQTSTPTPDLQPVAVPAAPEPPQPSGYWLDVRATAYSPADPLDSDYRRTKGPRWLHICADGETDVREEPYGIAVPRQQQGGRLRPLLAYGTKVFIPTGYGYLDQSRTDERIFEVDDTGSAITRRTQTSGVTYIDLRFRSAESARAWAGPKGYRELHVFVYTEP